jgi:RHS repeat-associated protein
LESTIRHLASGVRLFTLVTILSMITLLCTNAYAVSQQQTLPSGWSLVSVPINPTDPSASAVFDEVTPLHIYDYAGGQTLNLQEAGFRPITPGRARWLLLASQTTVNVDGTLVSTQKEYRVALTPGWNAIATPWVTAVKWNDAGVSVARGFSVAPLSQAVASGWIEGDIRNYQSPSGPYTTIGANSNPVGNLAAWKGYLLFSNISGELVFAPPPHNTNPPQIDILTPAEKGRVSTLTSIVGTADDDDLIEWKLEIATASKNQYTTIAQGNAPVTAASLAQLDPTLLKNGMILLRLSATDAIGNYAEVERTVLIDGDNKLGNFRITFVDLEVPVSGIPITIRRTYDSRDRGESSDFGYGWTLEAIVPGRYVNNRDPGDGWNFPAGPLGIPCDSATETASHVTEIRFSDREFYRFAYVAHPGAPITGGCQATGNFTQIGGIPGAALSDLSGNLANRLFWDSGSDQIIDTETTLAYVPANVRLTTLDGRKFDLNLQSGLYRIEDQNNNFVTITSAGVTHSSGESIAFTRDGAGRITAITDPMSASIGYTYDGAGNLVTVTNRINDTIGFGYDSSHFLTQITDGEGTTPLHAVYDAEGRVIQLLDADGNVSSLSNNVTANTSSATDRLGNTTQFVYGNDGYLSDTIQPGSLDSHYTYNGRGKPLTETDPLGHTTTYTYDSNDNLLTRIDPLNHTTSYTYDSKGRVLTTTDPRGKVTTNTYDAKGNLASVTDALNHTSSYTYDARGNMLTQTDPDNCTTTNSYNTRGRLIHTVDAEGAVRAYTYDGRGNQLTETQYRTVNGTLTAETSTNTYDASGRLTVRTDALNHSTTTTFNHNGRQKTQTDARNNTTTYQYDSRGNAFKTIYPDTTFEVYAYDLEGRKTATTDRNGHTNFTEYDGLGRVSKSIHPDASFTKNTYDDAGRLTSTTNERNFSTSFGYDNAGRRTKVTDALGHQTQFAYDVSGNQLIVTDANNHITTNEYDDDNRQVKVTFDDGSYKTTTYDPAGRKIAEVDQAGKTTQFGYDCMGRLTSVTDALTHITSYSYDETGNQITQTDANNHTTHFEYNANGQRTKRTLPLGQFELMLYDPAGNLQSHNDFNSASIAFTYDAENRLSRKDYPDHSFVSFTYTPAGQRQTVTDYRGVTSYLYDNRDRLTQVTHPNASTISYGYDVSSNRTSLTIPSGTTSYTFDELNRLKTVTDSDSGVGSYSYDDAGNRATVAYPNGTVASYTYNDLNRLTNLANKKSDNSVISSYGYTLGASGNRTNVLEQDGRTVGYNYDDLYRLTAENIVDPAHGNRSIGYIYDNVGNRQTKTDVTAASTATTNYVYDDNDRLLSESTVDSVTGTSSTAYGYDNNGSTLSKLDSTGTTNYSYDFESRLTHVDAPGKTIDYQYDSDGNRTWSKVNGVVTNHLVDTNRDYAQVLEERDGVGNLVVRYTYGDDLISQKRGSAVSYYHYDGQMSTRVLTDAAQAITDAYTYDAFGVLLRSSSSTANEYLYTGEQLDANTGFYYLRARYYNQAAGRFESMDSAQVLIKEPMTIHRYLYVQNMPLDRTDPSGLYSSSEQALGYAVERALAPIYRDEHPGDIVYFGSQAKTGLLPLLKPDIMNLTKKYWAEIKPLSTSGITKGYAKSELDNLSLWWSGYSADPWHPPSWVTTDTGVTVYLLKDDHAGLIFYSRYNVKKIFRDALLITSGTGLAAWIYRNFVSGVIQRQAGQALAAEGAEVTETTALGTLEAEYGGSW